jgi:uncharacterized protein YndB with AHSA1/START domain
MMIKKEQEGDLYITVGLDCRAPRKKVFETWTQPDWLKKWFRADEGFTCTTAEVDLRVGGRFALAMAMPGQPNTRFEGIYQVVRENDALVYTWSGGEGDHVTLVTALFSDRGTGSRVDFTHGVFATHEAKEGHARGWIACWNMLEKVLEEGAG